MNRSIIHESSTDQSSMNPFETSTWRLQCKNMSGVMLLVIMYFKHLHDNRERVQREMIQSMTGCIIPVDVARPANSFVNSSFISFIRSFIPSFIHHSFHSFIHSVIHSFIQSVIHSIIQFIHAFLSLRGLTMETFLSCMPACRTSARSTQPRTAKSPARSLNHG